MPSERFRDVIRSHKALRKVMGHPSKRAAEMAHPAIDSHFEAFIANSPFVLIASADGTGRMDISPRGDHPGFVRVLDERTLAIPDRAGNRRGDTFSNLVENNQVALFFVVPGVSDSLRVQGQGYIVRDADLRESMADRSGVPELALVVEVEEAQMHCSKCVVRSKLWDADSWPEPGAIPSLVVALDAQLKARGLTEGVEAEETEDVVANW